MKGANQGIHAILVRLRDDQLKTMPGVTIEDMGHRMGLNGVDNAKLTFDNVRVPRENLLNKYRYVSQIRQRMRDDDQCERSRNKPRAYLLMTVTCKLHVKFIL